MSSFSSLTGIAGDVEHRVDATGLELGQRLLGVDGHHLARSHLRQLEEQARREVGAAALPADRDSTTGELVELGDPPPADEMHFLVVQREDHLRLLRDPREHRIALQPRDERQHVGLHDPHLHAGALIHGEDVLDRPLGRMDGQVDAVRLHELLQVETELIVGALLRARDEAHVLGGEAHADAHQEHHENQQAAANTLRHRAFPPWCECAADRRVNCGQPRGLMKDRPPRAIICPALPASWMAQ